jgi:hypothetical protein
MQRRSTSFPILVVALAPAVWSCGSDGENGEASSGVEPNTPEMMAQAEP